MKKLTYLMIILVIGGAAVAKPTIACDYVRVYEKIWDSSLGSWNDKVVWYHDNPFDGDYQAAVDEGCIDWVKLTIKAKYINTDDEEVAIRFYDAQGTTQYLSGYLHNGENYYYLDPEWLDGSNKVKAKIDFTDSFRCDFKDDAFIKWSKLCVASECPVVPAPGAIVLGSIGTFMIAALRTAKTRKS